MIRIVILESPVRCRQCVKAEEVVYGLAREYAGGIEVRVLSTLDEEADRYGIVMTPTVVVNDVIVSTGKAPRPERLEGLVLRLLGRG